MKTPITLCLIFLSSFLFGQIESPTYSLDKAHSRLGFKIKHKEIVDVNGEFSSFQLTFKFENQDWKKSSFNLIAEASSINTGIESRDNHLRSEDFFDVEHYPNLSFVSKKITRKRDNILLEGELTMHGITGIVVLKGKINGPVESKGGNIIGLHLTGPVKRSYYKIGKISPGIADDVFLHADIELVSE